MNPKNIRRSYALTPEMVTEIKRLVELARLGGLSLSDGAIVRMALIKGLPLLLQSFRLFEGSVLDSEGAPLDPGKDREYISNGGVEDCQI